MGEEGVYRVGIVGVQRSLAFLEMDVQADGTLRARKVARPKVLPAMEEKDLEKKLKVEPSKPTPTGTATRKAATPASSNR